MSNVEIEDVLSSIRRLVSEDLRVAPAAAAEPARKPVPRLVLTEALRVDAPRAPAEPVEEPVSPPALAARLAELEAILDAQEQAFDDEADAAAPAPMPLMPRAPEPDPVPEIVADPVPEAPFRDDDTLAAEAAPDFAWTEAPRAEEPPAAAVIDHPAPAMQMLDEALLRDLIRDVLREELQGEIGERVTRNLRKMIRTEIGRALTARGVL